MNHISIGNRGASIVPRARRSIHSHNSSPFGNNEIMGKYSLRNKPANLSNTSGTTSQMKSFDEVDNVMSKFQNSSHERKQDFRRNSLDSSKQLYSEESDDNDDPLGKSLPAILPSYYSDVVDDHPLANRDIISRIRDHNTSRESVFNDRSSYSESINSSNNYDSAESSRFTDKEYCVSINNNEKPRNFSVLAAIAILTAIIACYFNLIDLPIRTSEIKYDEDKFYNDMSDLRDRYKVHVNSILQVETGISTIFVNEDTGSFIFMYNSRKPNFNYSEFINFVDDVATTAARYLRNESKSIQHFTISSSDLDMETDSELISRYRSDVARTGVMLVKELDEIPSRLAMAFHYYCDEYNPLVKRSAIFFTLDLGKCSNTFVSDKNSPHVHVEKCLTVKWNNVPQPKITPLLNRVVSVIIDLTSVF